MLIAEAQYDTINTQRLPGSLFQVGDKTVAKHNKKQGRPNWNFNCVKVLLALQKLAKFVNNRVIGHKHDSHIHQSLVSTRNKTQNVLLVVLTVT